jgi:hypothetical protein
MALGRRFPAPLFRRLATVIWLVLCCPGPGRVATARDLDAFVGKYCGDCHGGEDPAADLRLDTLATAPTAPDDLAVWKRVYENLESRRMPPDEASQPPSVERRAALDWIRTTLAAQGAPVDPARGRASVHGNWVDHELLFSGRAEGDSATPSRVWRLSDEAYEAFLTRLGKGSDESLRDLSPPWQLRPGWSFPDYSSAHQIGETEVEIHVRACQRIARSLLKNRPFKTPPYAPLAAVVQQGAAATRSQVTAAVVAAFEVLLGRRPDTDEATRYTAFLAEELRESGGTAGMEQFLTAVLCHPSVLYRLEHPPAGVSRGLPPPEDLARSLSFALTDREPDAPLAAAAADGQLTTATDVRRQVERILADDTIAKPRVVRFFRDYFGYETAPEVFKDAKTQRANGIVAWTPTYFVTDADRLVAWVLARDRDVLKELLTTNQTFALTYDPRRYDKDAYYTNTRFGSPQTPPETRFPKEGGALTTLAVYELNLQTRAEWSPNVPYQMPAEHRLGLLTHPAWLVAHSSNFDNHAIHRGRWIRERLLGGVVPEVPITVDAMLPDEPHRTLRDRMTVTRQAECWKCHKAMDPLGLPFEQFDHFGRFRTAEQVVDATATETLRQQDLALARRRGRDLPADYVPQRAYKKVPLDTSGAIEEALDPTLNGPVRSPFELIRRLADSTFVEQVFVRHAFRFFLGRNETYADGPTLVAAHTAYVNHGGSMRALIAELLTSNAFLQRTAPVLSPRDDQPTGVSR